MIRGTDSDVCLACYVTCCCCNGLWYKVSQQLFNSFSGTIGKLPIFRWGSSVGTLQKCGKFMGWLGSNNYYHIACSSGVLLSLPRSRSPLPSFCGSLNTKVNTTSIAKSRSTMQISVFCEFYSIGTVTFDDANTELK